MTVLVVGGGIAGVACARVLADRGAPVRIRERAHSVGGRMASRTIAGRPVDLGAAYFTVRDPGFARVVAGWRARGLARPWTDTLGVLAGGTRTEAEGPLRWAAPGGLRSLVTALAEGIDVELRRPVELVAPGPTVDRERVDAVVLAMPDPQAHRLVHPASPAASATAARHWNPVIAVAVGYARRDWARLPAAFVNGHPVLSLVADDGARRGDGAPVLVAHSTAAHARAHDAEPDGAVPDVLAALRELLGIRAEPEWTHAHRWRFAAPARERDKPFHEGVDGVCLAGDGWGSPRVETAWRSGTLLGAALAQRFG